MKPRCIYLVFGLVMLSMAWLAFVDSASADLVAYWLFDGDATASVGTSGTLEGTTGTPVGTADRFATPNSALAFDGTGEQYVNIADGGGLQGAVVGTISMWVQWTSSTQDQGHASFPFYGNVMGRQEDNVMSEALIGLDGADPASANILVMVPSNSGSNRIGSAAAAGGDWRHIAVTFQSHLTGGTTLYVDGVPQGTTLCDAFADRAVPLSIGAWLPGGASFSTSNIDDVAIFDDLLSPAQIEDLYDGDATPGTVGPGTRPTTKMPLTGVVATATSEFNAGSATGNRRAAQTTDGLGRLTGDPGGTVGAHRGMWLSNNESAPDITFDLGEVLPLEEFVLWNYNEDNSNAALLLHERGVKDVDIYTSLDGMSWDAFGGVTFDAAPGIWNDNFGQTVDMGGIETRYVKLDVLNNHTAGGTGYTGINEVDFYRVPEPSTLALLVGVALGLLVLGARRRRRAT